MAKTRRRVLSILMALVLTLGLLPTAALAGSGDTATGTRVVKQGQPVTSRDELVTVEKTAEYTGGNSFNITLTVTVTDQVTTTQENPVHVVLVMDESASMDKDRMDAAKVAARTFVNIVLGEDAAAENKIAVVDFSERASTVQNLSSNKAEVLGAINRIEMRNKGTNIQAGIHQAKAILDNDANFQGQKVILVFSDGMPTYSYRATGTAQGTCDENWWGEHRTGSIISGTEVFQNFDYDKIVGTGNYYDGYSESYGMSSWKVSHVYGTAQVTCSHNVTWTDNRCDFFTNHGDPTIREAQTAGYPIYSIFLDGYGWDEREDKQNAQYTMNGIAVNGGKYQTTENLADLAKLFEGVAEDITTPTDAGIVTDPMGQYIQLGDVTALADKGIKVVDGGLEWEVTKGDKTEESANTTTYSVTYPVTLDTNGDGFKSNEPYPTNGTTTFHYSVNGADREVDFDVPTVAGLKDYQVVYTWATGSGQPSDVTLPASATVTEENSSTYQVAALPSTDLSDFSAITGWHVSDDPDSEKITGLSIQDLAKLDTDNDRLITLYAYCQQLGTLTISKTFSYDGSKTGAPANFNAEFVVKDENGTEKARLSYADLSDSSKNPITLPYGDYTVTEENVVGNPGTAYNSSPVKTYKVGNQDVTTGFELKNSAMTVTVNNHYQYSNAPYLEIEKDATATVVVGETIEYTITVTNNGGSDATGVVVTDNLPTSGLDLTDVKLYDKNDVEITNDDVAKYENGIVTWNPGTTAGTLTKEGGTDSLTIKVRVEEDTELTSIMNWASVTYTGAPDGYNEKDNATTTITRSNLSVAKTAVTYSTYDPADPTTNVVSANGTTAQPGNTIVYTITVTNSGDAAASNVSVTDKLPDSGYAFVSATDGEEPSSDGKITWTGLTVTANGGQVEKQVVVTVNDLANPSQGISLTNTAVLGEQESTVTTTVGATKGTLTISKTISGVPAEDTDAWNVLSGLTFTVEKQVEEPVEGGGTSTVWQPVSDLTNIAITAFDGFKAENGTYTYNCGNVEPGTYRVVEAGGYDLSACGYTRDEDNETASDAVTVTAGVGATASITNTYTGKTYTIIFDAGEYGKVDGRTGTWTWTWTEYEPTDAAAYYDWAIRQDSTTGNSKVAFTFTQDQYLTYKNSGLTIESADIPLTVVVDGATAKTGTPVESGVENGKYYFNNGEIFTSIADAYAAMNAAGVTEITYTADYTFTYTFTDYGSSNVEMGYWVAGLEGEALTDATANTKVTEQANLESIDDYKTTIFFVKAKSGYQINDTSSLKVFEGTKSGTEQTWELIELDEDTVAPDGMTADTWAAAKAAALNAGYTHFFSYTDNTVFNHWFKVTATKDPVVALGGTKIVALGGNTAPGEQIFTFKLETFVEKEEEGPVAMAVNRVADVPGYMMTDSETKTVTTNGAGQYPYAFDEITYTEEGTYFYRLYEVIPEVVPSNWTYDQSVYYITVHVYEKDTTGQLVAEVLYQKAATPDAEIGEAADAVIFTNTYTRNTSTGPIDPGPVNPGPGTIIPDEGTPTTDLPEEETPTTELPEEETPTTELPEEEVPMAEVPATGDTAGLWALAAGVSGLALVWLALTGKKRREENA